MLYTIIVYVLCQSKPFLTTQRNAWHESKFSRCSKSHIISLSNVVFHSVFERPAPRFRLRRILASDNEEPGGLVALI